MTSENYKNTSNSEFLTQPTKPFYYPDTKDAPSQRMCASGQRRAAFEGWNLIVDGGDIGKEETLRRAVRAERALQNNADVNKHVLISEVVFEHFCDGILSDYIDPEGNYVLETFTGETLNRNIFLDIQSDKTIF